MASCPKCHASVADGMTFCTQCGASIEQPAPVQPAPPVTPPPAEAGPPSRPESEEELVAWRERDVPKPSAKPARSSSPAAERKFEGLNLEIPVDSSLDEDEAPRRPSGAEGELICRFCKGPLSLEAGFCEYCGAPIEEAAPPGLLKPKPAPPPASPAAKPPPAEGQAGPPPAALPNEGVAVPSPPRPAKPSPPPAAKPKTPVSPIKGSTPEAPPAAKPVPTAPTPRPAPRAAPPSPAQPAPAKQRTPTPPAPSAVATPKAEPSQPEEAVTPKKKAPPLVAILVGIVVVLLVAGGAAWYLLHPKPAPPAPSVPAAKAPVPTRAPGRATAQPPPEGAAADTAASRAKAARVVKRAPTPPPPPASPALSPEQVKLANLENLAREAYAKGNYAEPAEASAIAYAKQALALRPDDDYAKRLLEDAIHGGTYQVQQAIATKDFATARRIAGVMIQLLPDRKDVAGLREDIASAERRQ